MPPRVYITRRLADEALYLIRSECSIEVYPQDRPMLREEILDAVTGID